MCSCVVLKVVLVYLTLRMYLAKGQIIPVLSTRSFLLVYFGTSHQTFIRNNYLIHYFSSICSDTNITVSLYDYFHFIFGGRFSRVKPSWLTDKWTTFTAFNVALPIKVVCYAKSPSVLFCDLTMKCQAAVFASLIIAGKYVCSWFEKPDFLLYVTVI